MEKRRVMETVEECSLSEKSSLLTFEVNIYPKCNEFNRMLLERGVPCGLRKERHNAFIRCKNK